MSGLNPGTVGAIVSLTIDQSQARRLGIGFSTCEVKSLDTPSRQRTNTACCCFSSLDYTVWNRFKPPSPISTPQGYRRPVPQSAVANSLIDYWRQPALVASYDPRQPRWSLFFPGPHTGTLPISPTRDIEGQCPSPPSPISPTRDIEGQCPSPPSPISSIKDIKSQCSVCQRQ
ncbi:hypothetical protein PoB_005791400 [Plakobranchus ocellatus]|uniref:Uncharacterized protein n=1 Tax=Plakobranchus ocellatus TaxID=259542 RepID=A0AAV4CKH3_9GAST|nr:hypothetical protein PoB_005791400 [Plakobranchus ocellatus]